MNEIATNIMNVIVPTAAPSGGAQRLGREDPIGRRRVAEPEAGMVPDRGGEADSSPARQGNSTDQAEGSRKRQSAGRGDVGKKAEGTEPRQRRGLAGQSPPAATRGTTARLNNKDVGAEASPGLEGKSPFAALLRMVAGLGTAAAPTAQPAEAKSEPAKGQPQAPVAAQPSAAGLGVVKAVVAVQAVALAQMAAPAAANGKSVAQVPAGEMPKPLARPAPANGKVISVAPAVVTAGKGATAPQAVAQAAPQPKADRPAGEAQPAGSGQVPAVGKAGQAAAKNVSARVAQPAADQALAARVAGARQQASQPQAATPGEPLRAAMRAQGPGEVAAPAAGEGFRLAEQLKARLARRSSAPASDAQPGHRVGSVKGPQAAGEAPANVAQAASAGPGRAVVVEFSSGQVGEVGQAPGRAVSSDGASAPGRLGGPDLSQAPESSMIDQIARVVRANAARTGRQIVVRLNPPELGRVRLTLHADGSDVRGVLKVESPETFAELQREAGALVQRLAESGVQLRRLDVDLTDNGSQGSDSGGSPARGGQGQTHGGPADMGQQTTPDSTGEGDRSEADAAATIPNAYHVDDESINVWI